MFGFSRNLLYGTVTIIFFIHIFPKIRNKRENIRNEVMLFIETDDQLMPLNNHKQSWRPQVLVNNIILINENISSRDDVDWG